MNSWIKKERVVFLGTAGEFDQLGLRLPPEFKRNVDDENNPVLLSLDGALIAALALMKRWGFTVADQAAVLGVTPKTYARYRQGKTPGRSDQIQRIEDILRIQRALYVLLPNRVASDRPWVMKDNAAFDGRSALAVMREQGPRRVRQFLEAELFSKFCPDRSGQPSEALSRLAGADPAHDL